MGNQILFPVPLPSYTVETPLLQDYLVWIYDKSGLGPKRFPCLWFSAEDTPHTLLYFHGNSVDLGEIINEMYIIHQHVGCNLLAIEFPGYGVCSDTPVEPSLIDNWGLAAFEWLTENGVNPMSIVLIGRSIGTGPAAKLGASLRRKNITPGGLILHCPYMSIHKIVSDYMSLGTWFIPNYWDTEESLKLTAPTVPLLIIHGLNDQTISVFHGQTLYSDYKVDSSLKQGFFPKDSPHNAYLVIEDVAMPINDFLQTKSLSRVCVPFTFEPAAKDKSPPKDYQVSRRPDELERLSSRLQRRTFQWLSSRSIEHPPSVIKDTPAETVASIRSLGDIFKSDQSPRNKS